MPAFSPVGAFLTVTRGDALQPPVLQIVETATGKVVAERAVSLPGLPGMAQPESGGKTVLLADATGTSPSDGRRLRRSAAPRPRGWSRPPPARARQGRTPHTRCP